MSFTYDPSTPIGMVRLLVADTDATQYIWSDEEINGATQIVTMMFAIWIPVNQGTSQTFGSPSPYRVAATLLDSLAANRAKLMNVLKVLDVQLDTTAVATELRAQAAAYREVDDESAGFAIIELVQNQFSARERAWKMLERLQGTV